MVRLGLLIALLFEFSLSFGQEINITFAGAGASTKVDSVTATNLTTNKSITFPGNETLILSSRTGIIDGFKIAGTAMLYPNPFCASTALTVSTNEAQWVNVAILNQVGQIIAQTSEFLLPGTHEWRLSVNNAGFYWVNLTSRLGTDSFKIICMEASDTFNQIHYQGMGFLNTQSGDLKVMNSSFNLGYNPGDIILYKCFSGIYATVITDSPEISKNYEVEFVLCADPDGKNYPVLKIGDQYWMAENLAYLPAVSPAYELSDTSAAYYVYGYNGSDVGLAKTTSTYATYGAFYNFFAAKKACPQGWHLPTDAEWQKMEIYLGMSENDANSERGRFSGAVGLKLKETGSAHWLNSNYSCSNSTGFTALPAGIPCYWGGFDGLGHYTTYWTASDGGCCAMSRTLDKNSSGVGRAGSLRWQGYSVRCLKDD